MSSWSNEVGHMGGLQQVFQQRRQRVRALGPRATKTCPKDPLGLPTIIFPLYKSIMLGMIRVFFPVSV